MTTAELKTLKISGQTVFSKMEKWGWVDANAREIPWFSWIGKKFAPVLLDAPPRYDKGVGERLNKVRTLRHDRPLPSRSYAR